MWRTLRQVFKNPGNAPRRLGQIQAAEKNEDVKNLSTEEQKDRARPLIQPNRKVFLAAEAEGSRFYDDAFNTGFEIVQCITRRFLKEERTRALKFSTYFASGKQESSDPYSGEIGSWCSGVLALSSLLACRKAFTDEKSPWHINVKSIPAQVLSRLLTTRPYASLGILPVTETIPTHKGNAKPTDPLDEAIATFQSSFSECTAATQNKLGIKFASLRQHQKAFLLFTQASERGHPLAQFNLGLCYESGKGVDRDLAKAADCYKTSAAQGHAGAMYNLALLYMDGLGGLPKDPQLSLELLEKAAENGLCKAQSYLGLYYSNESSSHCDYDKAVPYFKLAAAKKDSSAEYNLGICYERGLGTERDMSKAAYLYKVAAEHGHIGAQYNLGVFYEHGLGGFAVDKKEAARYYRMAAEAGDEDARHNYLLIRKQLESMKHARQPIQPQNLVFSLFKKMTQPASGGMSVQDSLPRCASSPGILDDIPLENSTQNVCTASNKQSNPLLAF